MKKLISFFTVILILLTFAFNSVYAAAGAAITGPSTVRAGDTITLTLKVSASTSKAYVVAGKFTYNSDQVTLSGITDKLSGWSTVVNGDIFYSENAAQNNSIKSNTTLLTAKFKVKSSLSAGTKINISVADLDIANETGQYSNSASYSVTLAQPLSGDATLKRLSIEEGTLSPAFSSSVTEYNIGEVPFSVSKLDITATANHSGANVSISGNSLSVGKNTVKITVTAETGAKKEYTITVIRAQDPNYVASSNAALSEITLSTGTLSPVFDKEKLEYIVYVPFETETISIDGRAEDSKATEVTGVEDAALAEGENALTVTCKAEDGTELVYTVTVVRMPEYGVATSTLPGDDTSSTGSQPESSTESQTGTFASTEPTVSENGTSSEMTVGDTHEKGSDGEPGTVTWILLLIIALVIGFLICFILMKAGAFGGKNGDELGKDRTAYTASKVKSSNSEGSEKKKKEKQFTFDDK